MTAHPARVVPVVRREWRIPVPARAALTLWLLVLLAVCLAVAGVVALVEDSPGVVMSPDQITPSPQPAGL